MQIIQSYAMTETQEDWSRVRSPSRAIRRMRLGHRQNVIMREVPRKDAFFIGDRVYVHPQVFAEMSRILDEFSEKWSRAQ